MEELKTIIVNNWPEVLSYVLNFIAYFLFLIYRARFTKTKNNMRVLFNDKVKQVNTIDKNMRADVNVMQNMIQQELSKAKEEYKKSKAEYDTCIAELSRMGKALVELIIEEGVDDGTND